MNIDNLLSEGSQSQRTCVLYGSIYMNVQNKLTHRDRRLISGCHGAGRNGEGPLVAMEFLLGVMKMF